MELFFRIGSFYRLLYLCWEIKQNDIALKESPLIAHLDQKWIESIR